MAETDGQRRSFSQLVVVGSSAGGIDALSTLVATLPTDFPAPIVIAQHLDPTRPSALPAILARRSTLPVRTVEEHAPLEAGVVFVVPANRHVLITDSAIDLRVDGNGRPVPSINLLLETAAAVYGEDLIAVILTGTGSDGAAGARYVKNAGGTVVIQNPNTAAHPGMPQSLAPNTVDVVADLERIGPILRDLLAGVEVPVRPAEEKVLGTFLERVREQHGIDFGSYKLPTIRRRLQRRIVATGRGDLAGYLDYLDAHPEEYPQLVSSFLIKVTDFFRDPELFAYLREVVLPELIDHARRRDRELRIWSAGCATGEEAYSLAILVAELLGHDLADWNIRIFSTDLDAEAIAFARQGIYSAAAVAGLPDDLIARCFTVEDKVYQIRKHIRALTVFGQHDLGQRAPFPRIDLVLCRNVLIYFTPELQKRALQLFAYSLRDQGFLVLGKAESTSPLADYFALQHHQFRVYRRHGERILMPSGRPPYPLPPVPQRFPAAGRGGNGGVARLPRPEQRNSSRYEAQLLKLPVGLVVVNRRYDIQSINGVARRLLAIYSAAIGDDLVHLAQRVPQRPLREAIERTFRTGSSTSLAPFAVEAGLTDTRRYLQLICYPQRADDERGPVKTVLLVVNDVTDTVQVQRDEADAVREGPAVAEEPEARARRQEEVLARLAETNRQLLEANQELLSANEDLRTANEEFVLSVEGAQASTEEIETLNEEMQATNEELETLNEELQATVEELNTTNDELHARSIELQEVAQESEVERARLAGILHTMHDAVLVLDRAGRPLLTNPSYEQLFGPADAPFAAEDTNGRALSPQALPQGRAARGEAFSMEFTVVGVGGERRWFEANSQPFYDQEGRFQWSIVVIRDITDRSLHLLQEQFLALASHELRTPLTSLQGYLQMLDRQGREGQAQGRAPQYLRNALMQSGRLVRLVDDLVDVVRLQDGKFYPDLRPIALAPTVEQAVAVAQMLATGQTIELEAEGAPLRVNGDVGRLEQVLLNLLTNAITYAPGTARIAVRLRRVGGAAEIQVQDYGQGIPAADLPRLFTRFYQATRDDQRPRRGLGLGLFITHELVVAHGGTITVVSTEGQGSTFTIRLPLLAEGAE